MSSLGCYFLSHIYLGFPCFFWASGVSPVSSGSFACVATAAHCCAVLCFQILLDYWADLHMWLQSYTLARTSHWQGRGDHLESPCPILSPQWKTPAKRKKMLWVDEHQNGQVAGVQDKKGWETGYVQPGKEKAKGDITTPFHLATKGYREDGTRPFSEVQSIWTGQKGYKLHQEKFFFRKKNKFPRKMVQQQNRAQSICGCPPY